MIRSRLIAICVVSIGIASTLLLPSRGSGVVQTTPAPADFGEFLLARDLVVVGSVIDARAATRRPIGGCGAEYTVPMPVIDVTVRVSSVWVGTAEDSVLQMSIIGSSDSSSVPSVGSTLLLWANRSCDDGWRLWGNFATVSAAGNVLGRGSDRAFIVLAGQSHSSPPYLDEVHMALTDRSFTHATKNIDGASALGLAQVTQIVPRDEGGYTYLCDSLGFVMGTATRVPHFVDFPLVPDCYPMILPGDSILVPIPSGFTGTRISLTTCPRALAIKQQFLPAFGVPLSFVQYVIGSDAAGLEVKSFVRRDGE